LVFFYAHFLWLLFLLA